MTSYILYPSGIGMTGIF